jgi:hypothetical protein
MPTGQYGGATPVYEIPFPVDGDPIDSAPEHLAASIIENGIRAGILGAGGTRVYAEGTYTAETDAFGITTVTLLGSPSVLGIAANGLVESNVPVVWTALRRDREYWLYVRASRDTYIDPADFEAIALESPLTDQSYLLLASVDTAGATTAAPPAVDNNPDGKATGFNLFQLLNSNTDPFGPTLTQSILTVLQSLRVFLSPTQTMLVSQQSSAATQPVITIENQSARPEIRGAAELRLADSRLLAGFALTDTANPAYTGAAISIVGALNESLQALLDHIGDSDDPHGPDLVQTRLVLRELLTVPRLLIDPPPSPPSPPSPPGSESGCEIQSTGRLRLCDGFGGAITLSEDGHRIYTGQAVSLIGALNELRLLIAALAASVDALLGVTVKGTGPVGLQVRPEEIGYPLHFKIEFSEDDDFADMTMVADSSSDADGWWYEHYDPCPPAPPTSPPSPPESGFGSGAGMWLPWGEAPLDANESPCCLENPPLWKPLPSTGLPGSLQASPDGEGVSVQYRPGASDPLFSRRTYRLRAYQISEQESCATLGTVTIA